jgi:cell wall-associated NlpC family hydrolase
VIFDYQDLIGTLYEDGGRGPNYDCYGLVMECYRRFGIHLPDYNTLVDDTSKPGVVLAAMGDGWEPVEEIEFGDVILFKVGGINRHVGIAVESGYFIHILFGASTVRQPLNHMFWRNRIVGFYRYGKV